MKKNLVMAAAKGYSFYDLEPFLLSFKKFCTSADLVLFVDELSDFTENKIKNLAENITLEKIPAELKGKLIIDLRWTMYKKFLDANSDYEKIFVTDIADVIFQADIFEKFPTQKNFVVYAAEGITIEGDPGGFNQLYFQNFLTPQEYQKIKSKTVICCGTVLGSREEMKILFDKMLEMLKRSKVWGDEQAGFNFLIHNKLLPIKNLVKSDVERGEILTCSVLKDYQVAQEKILRGDGKIPAVVHQYNRKPALIAFVNETYRDKVFDFDANFSDFKSLLDQTFSLVSIRNFEQATKIFVEKLFYDSEIKNCGKKLLKLYELILTKISPQNLDEEILSVAVQNLIAEIFASGIDKQDLDKIYSYYSYSKQIMRTVTAPLEIFLSNIFMRVAENAYNSGDKNLCLECLQRVEKINLPNKQEFYLTLAKIYREIGDKEKALATYQKALEITS